MKRLTIPVQIDSIKNWEGFQRTRCIYYRIELEDGYAFRRMRYLARSSAIFASGVSWAALAGPILEDGKEWETFQTPQLVENTLDSLQSNDKLFLDLGYLWVPNLMFVPAQPGEAVREGDVYRLSMPYFRHCYRFSVGRIGEQEWLAPRRRFIEPITPSPLETESFRTWRRAQIAVSRRLYHEEPYAPLRLAKKVEDR